MGWTCYHATEYKKNGAVNRKAECDKQLTWENDNWRVSVVKSQMVGTTYYAAVKREDKHTGGKEVVGMVMLTCGIIDRNDPYFNFGYKDIPETMGPNKYDCPVSILNLLTSTDSEWANEWREKCYENAKKTKLSDLPIGTVIKFTNWNGDEYILTKMAPNYQFKKTWWYNAENDAYMPSRRITNFVVID